ncbi:cyclic nucleotide-binding domain-containing protein [Bradyrhizobium sp. LHD-71]|uniref:cyclic nucleotide-binding domain-containing protein n=1 Tax=Bradyrhizobium sp. LHD-71 TaxID=3072141 RepID=UPI00280E67D7|nr:cyclic nucleotide-binding domain-containing protein [Bradyrhizobium sp. LHD-71]MDQ8727942.1 cyclic nucleotide-binding domain-containing protein [Bradyrhizobium sp. LHD-71]
MKKKSGHLIPTAELVRKVPFFSNLAPDAVVDLTSMLRRLELPPRATVVEKDAPGDCMYFIASGEVEVELPGRKIPLTQGSFFGELALLSNSVRTATVVTRTDTTLLVLDLVAFRTLMARHHDLAAAIDLEARRRTRENLQRSKAQ